MKHLALLVALAAAALSCGAEGATKPAAAPPAESGSMGKFGDWEVRCFSVQSPAPCDMVQLLTQKSTGAG